MFSFDTPSKIFIMTLTFIVGFQVFAVGSSFICCIVESYNGIFVSGSSKVALRERMKVTNVLSRNISPFPEFLIPA